MMKIWIPKIEGEGVLGGNHFFEKKSIQTFWNIQFTSYNQIIQLFSSRSLGPGVKIVSILTFFENRGLMKTVQGIKKISRKKKSSFKLGSSQQFENNRLSWPIFTSRISKILNFF
jgi:hypothetical protein